MNPTVHVVDDFYSDPDRIRHFALSCQYVSAWGSWRGVHSLERTPDTETALFRIARLVSDKPPNWEEIDASYQFWKKAACGGFAAMFEGQRGVIHAHRRSGDWAGVVYFSRPQDCAGRKGTIFYRHNATALVRYEQENENFARAKNDAEVENYWTEISTVEMKYNRLVLFDSRYFHGASPGFGHDIVDGRLIQVFNFVVS